MFVYAMTVGPVATNCYLLGDERTRTGAIIDPGANGKEIAEIAKQSGYQFDKVLLTHSHFDHITGLGELLRNLNPDLPIYVHKSDYPGAEAGFGSDLGAEKFFDIIGEILAVVMVLVYALLILNANFEFIPEGTFMNVLEIMRTYGSLLLVGVVGLEAMSKRNFIFQIIFLALLALIVIFLFFPGTYENLIGIVKK